MRKIFEVYIAKADAPAENETFAELSLPAMPYGLFDAMDKARIGEGGELYFEIENYDAFEFLAPLLSEQGNLLELNALAQKLSELDDRQSTSFEGLVIVEIQKEEGPIPMPRLIDLAHSADCCYVVDEALNAAQLCRFYAKNGFVPEVESLPENIFKLLDFEAIGREARQAEGGVFTEHGYVVQHTELTLAFQNKNMTLRTPDYQILLGIPADGIQDPSRDSVCTDILSLPGYQAIYGTRIKELAVTASEQRRLRCLDCRIPGLAGAVENAGLQEINSFAELLQGMGDKQMLAYKAILDAVGCASLDAAVTLAGHLDEFVLSPHINSARELAVEQLRFMMSDEDAQLLAKHTDLHGYGKEILDCGCAAISPYGMVERSGHQPLHTPLEQPEQGGMEMK